MAQVCKSSLIHHICFPQKIKINQLYGDMAIKFHKKLKQMGKIHTIPKEKPTLKLNQKNMDP